MTLTFGEEESGVANEYLFQFESGNEATTLALPEGIIWANDEIPVIESNYTYQVSILNGFAAVMKFKKPVVIISFTIDGTAYQAEEGMTWEQWLYSKYNTKNHQIYDGAIIDNNYSYWVTTDVGSTSLVSPSAVISAEHEYGRYLTGGGGGGT